MDEPPQKPPLEEPDEDLVEAWTIHNLRRLAEMQARSGRLPPVRSVTPAPRSLTPTPEPRVAEAPQGKDRSWTSDVEPSPTAVAEEDPPLSPERIAQLEREADAGVDRAYSKPPRTARQ
jgi:hypothetical protein